MAPSSRLSKLSRISSSLARPEIIKNCLAQAAARGKLEAECTQQNGQEIGAGIKIAERHENNPIL